MARRTLPLIAAAAVAALASAPGASALTPRPCPFQDDFRCVTVRVPLDRSGAVPGTIALKVAFEPSRRGRRGVLLALSGGPGQPSVDYADSFRNSLVPALRHRRLMLIDQRGTGGSGVLECRRLQLTGSLDPVLPRMVGDCGGKLGPARAFYSTTDSVLDIEAVRAALGLGRMELMGISYGTYVAVQYARAFPQRTEGLILDSVVGPEGLDPYLLDTFGALPRILREQCGRTACRNATRDPVRDLGRMTARLQRAPLHGVLFGPGGVARVATLRDESELLLLLMSGDINPFLQPALPGAINAALNGDPALLMRLRRLADGPPATAREFSAALNVTTTCSDATLPYSLASPYPERRVGWQHGIDAVPASAFAPFSRQGVLDTSLAHDCLRWPGDPAAKPPYRTPPPDVPTLVLSGRLDTRTPVETARSTSALFPHAAVVEVGGTGHDILDNDITGCAFTALGRWAAGRPVGTPCRGKTNIVRPFPRPPRTLGQFRSARGVGGRRGRVVFATLDTVVDAQVNALQTLYAGYAKLRGGGLRGGSFAARDDAGVLRLHDYALVNGVRVSGRVRVLDGGAAVGTVTIDGPGTIDGRLRLDRRGGATGRLGGRKVRYRPRADGAAAAQAGRGRLPTRLRLPSAPRLRAEAARLRGSAALRP